MKLSVAADISLRSVCANRQPDSKAAEWFVLTDRADCSWQLDYAGVMDVVNTGVVMKGGGSPETILQRAN
jgi:hypothetical protein